MARQVRADFTAAVSREGFRVVSTATVRVVGTPVESVFPNGVDFIETI